MEFHKTRMGEKFFNTDFPRAVTALERIASALEKDIAFKEKDVTSQKKKDILEFRKMKKEGMNISEIQSHIKSGKYTFVDIQEVKNHIEEISKFINQVIPINELTEIKDEINESEKV